MKTLLALSCLFFGFAHPCCRGRQECRAQGGRPVIEDKHAGVPVVPD